MKVDTCRLEAAGRSRSRLREDTGTQYALGAIAMKADPAGVLRGG